MTIFFLGFMSVLALLFGAVIVYGTIFVHREEGCSYFLAFLTVVLPMMARTHRRRKAAKNELDRMTSISPMDTFWGDNIFHNSRDD
jgi:hypothetical protein